jgi:LacI family transcriptional regulator
MAKNRTVLVALTSAHYGWFKGVARYAREHNWHLVADMLYTGQIPLGWQGDGIISYTAYSDALAKFVLSAGIPTVEISKIRRDLDLPFVEGDNEMVGRQAAEHFLERGYRNFIWAPLLDNEINADRFRGFADRLAMKGLSSHVLPPANSSASKGGAWNWAARRKLLVQEFQRLPKPLAVFGFNDRVAADLIDACHTAGLLVPEEVAVLGVDNDELLCECLGIPLSSVCHDLEGMGYRAAVLLDRLMSGKRLPKLNPRITPKGIATRRSSDMMAVNDLDVAKALRFICDKFTDPLLSVDDIVAVTSVSRRPLEKAFRQELRRTINEEVLRVRLEKVKDLIITTELSVAEISQLTGFTRPNHLFRIFRRQLGMNPKQFRAQHASRARSYPRAAGRHSRRRSTVKSPGTRQRT